MKKDLFNFYLDTDLKRQAINILEQKVGETSKGTLASFLRCCINNLVTGSNTLPDVDQILQEYEYSSKKNKRSLL